VGHQYRKLQAMKWEPMVNSRCNNSKANMTATGHLSRAPGGLAAAAVPSPTDKRAGRPATGEECRFCFKSTSWTTDAQTLSVHLKWHSAWRRPQERDSSNAANQNQDSILGGTQDAKVMLDNFATKSAANSREHVHQRG